MKIRFAIAFALLLNVLTSCKDEKPADPNQNSATQEEVVDVFKVTVEATVKSDDVFSLFYTEDGSINFEGNPIWIGVEGSEAVQQLTYNFPPDVYPTQLRLDFGNKPGQQDIILKSISFEYKGNKRVIAGQEMGNFFRPDESKCTFDPVTGVLHGLEKDGKKQFPSLYPHETFLQPELEKLVK